MTDELRPQSESLNISHWTTEEQIELIKYLIKSGILPKDDNICRGAIRMIFKGEQFSIPGASGKKVLYRKPIYINNSNNIKAHETYIFEFTARGVNISTGKKEDETRGIGDDTSDTVQQVLNIEYPDWVKEYYGEIKDPEFLKFQGLVFHPDLLNFGDTPTHQAYIDFVYSYTGEAHMKNIRSGEAQKKLLEKIKTYIKSINEPQEIKWISIKEEQVKVGDDVFNISNENDFILEKDDDATYIEYLNVIRRLCGPLLDNSNPAQKLIEKLHLNNFEITQLFINAIKYALEGNIRSTDRMTYISDINDHSTNTAFTLKINDTPYDLKVEGASKIYFEKNN